MVSSCSLNVFPVDRRHSHPHGVRARGPTPPVKKSEQGCQSEFCHTSVVDDDHPCLESTVQNALNI